MFPLLFIPMRRLNMRSFRCSPGLRRGFLLCFRIFFSPAQTITTSGKELTTNSLLPRPALPRAGSPTTQPRRSQTLFLSRDAPRPPARNEPTTFSFNFLTQTKENKMAYEFIINSAATSTKVGSGIKYGTKTYIVGTNAFDSFVWAKRITIRLVP